MLNYGVEEKDKSRRSFLNYLLWGTGLAFLGSVFYPVTRFMLPPKSGEANVTQVKLPVTRADLESAPQRSKTFKFGHRLGIIILTGSGTLKALSATCTHLDCTVQYRLDLGIIWCACHNGRYDLDGNNISGPPPQPLEQFAVNEIGGEIFVSKE